MVIHMETPHLEDGELLDLLDERGTSQDRIRWRVHLSGCAECTRRYESLESQAAQVSRFVGEIDLPPGFRLPSLPAAGAAPRSARRAAFVASGWLRAAAVILLLLLPFVAVPPLRALVTDWVAERLTQLTLPPERPPEPESSPAEAEAGSTLWFTPLGEELRLEVATRQAGGAIVLEATGGTGVSVEVVSGGSETPLLQAGGVRILNTASSTATYRITLPPSVLRARIQIGDDRPVVVYRDEIRGTRVLGLVR